MSSNDPWAGAQPDTNPNADHQCQDGTTNSNINNNTSDIGGFADNFSDKLPDHEEYLNRLETKLEKLKKKSSIAQELRNRRSDEARRMLDVSAAAVELFEDADLTENSALNRRLFPDRQALTMSEIAKLLENDTLEEVANEEPDLPEKSAEN